MRLSSNPLNLNSLKMYKNFQAVEFRVTIQPLPSYIIAIFTSLFTSIVCVSRRFSKSCTRIFFNVSFKSCILIKKFQFPKNYFQMYFFKNKIHFSKVTFLKNQSFLQNVWSHYTQILQESFKISNMKSSNQNQQKSHSIGNHHATWEVLSKLTLTTDSNIVNWLATKFQRSNTVTCLSSLKPMTTTLTKMSVRRRIQGRLFWKNSTWKKWNTKKKVVSSWLQGKWF